MIREIESTIGDSKTVYLFHNQNGVVRVDPDGFIMSAYVSEKARGKGIGTKLLNRAIEICKQRGCESIGLWVHNDNELAQKLYRRLGFVKFHQVSDDHTQFIKVL